jgi:3-isopropylmalate/(R)-2-methylmalate dehydratase small subunit
MKPFGGAVVFLDRNDINTDEIIPAKYLTEVKKENLKNYLLEDLQIDGFDPKGEKLARVKVVVTRANFGCGSSREHAPWALEVNDITLVIAESFARIFRQNMFNCGMMAVELPAATIEKIFKLADGDVTCDVDFAGRKLVFKTSDGRSESTGFTTTEFDSALVESGGWVEFADARY